MHWAVQTNLGSSEAEKLIKAFKQTGHSYTPLIAIPFTDRPLPDLPTDRPTIFYGSIGFIKPIWESRKWSPGAVFNENFDYRVWSQKWGARCLNDGATVLSIEEFSKSNHPADKLFFLRPCADDKTFTGTVLAFNEMDDWMRGIMGATPDFKDTPIAVSEPLGISAEWRLYILNGRVVTGSLYKKNFRPIRSPDVPHEVIEFGEATAKVWSPASLFTLDVAESGDELYVNEMGSFHSAGLYESDVPKLVSEISEYFTHEFHRGSQQGS